MQRRKNTNPMDERRHQKDHIKLDTDSKKSLKSWKNLGLNNEKLVPKTFIQINPHLPILK